MDKLLQYLLHLQIAFTAQGEKSEIKKPRYSHTTRLRLIIDINPKRVGKNGFDTFAFKLY
ncbi:MAG: hypothetical protein GY941_19355 [Planctomycetes bacterium]|nr:hypothetical protein [Planctomycetota bacterium]